MLLSVFTLMSVSTLSAPSQPISLVCLVNQGAKFELQFLEMLEILIRAEYLEFCLQLCALGIYSRWCGGSVKVKIAVNGYNFGTKRPKLLKYICACSWIDDASTIEYFIWFAMLVALNSRT